ncbi:hypothetical protein IAD21_03365 [Abditibacteriota bacterium]|nr:hypothetical protein IAD21_03365 [Abditibacteriota bacterium]
MKMLPYLVLTVALAVPAVAQGPTPVPQPVFSAALRARLHAHVVTLAPQLHLTMISSSFNGLALSAARLGDFDLALRLAKGSSEMDSVWQWRAAQLASVGKGEAALEASRHIQSTFMRAEALLAVARLEEDKGQVELARRALSAFSNLKTESPGQISHFIDPFQATQLAYGGYLWTRSKQPDAARRLWKRSWVLMLARIEQFDGRQGRVGQGGNNAAPQVTDSQARAQAEIIAAREFVPFIVHAGMMGDVLPYLHPEDSTAFLSLFSQVAVAARTPSQRQILRDWLLAHHGPMSSDCWKILALAESYDGNIAKSREDYSHATPLPVQKAKTTQDVSGICELTLANAWNDDALRSEAEGHLRVQMAGMPQVEAADVEGMILSSRLISFQKGQMKVRPMTREELVSATDKLLAIAPEKVGVIVLRIVAEEWRVRGDNEQVVRLAQAMAEAERAEMTRPKVQTTRDWEWRSQDVLQGATWLRLAGQKEEAESVAQQFAQDTPATFRRGAAIVLWRSGFAKAAATIFDPLTELGKQQSLPKVQKVNTPWEQFDEWEELTTAQARFVAPDAPARWFGKLPSAELKAHVLAAWIKALSPSLPDEVLYVHNLGG